MNKELRANLNLYLEIKENETEDMASTRLWNMLVKLNETNPDLGFSEFYQTEVQ